MSEYLVEVMPGRELLYRTPWALREAIRSGDITADSRIFHRATSSWISITEHPEYRKVQAEPHPPPFFEPTVPPESVAQPAAPRERRFFRGLAGMGAALATSGWASLKKRLDSYRTKSARSSTPARPPRPAPPTQPGKPAQQTEPQSPEPARNRWTFYP